MIYQNKTEGTGLDYQESPELKYWDAVKGTAVGVAVALAYAAATKDNSALSDLIGGEAILATSAFLGLKYGESKTKKSGDKGMLMSKENAEKLVNKETLVGKLKDKLPL